MEEQSAGKPKRGKAPTSLRLDVKAGDVSFSAEGDADLVFRAFSGFREDALGPRGKEAAGGERGARLPHLRVVDLGVATGNQVDSAAQAINNRGQVVGASWPKGSDDPVAFLWEAGKRTDLGTLGGARSEPFDINNCGDIVGRSRNDANKTRAFLWQGGRMVNLWPSTHSEAHGINDHGQIVGSFRVGSTDHACLWEEGELTDLTDLGVVGEPDSTATWINNRGQVVGESYHRDHHDSLFDGPHHAWLWENGKTNDLGVHRGAAGAINDQGVVVGSYVLQSWLETERQEAGFIWEQGQLENLGFLQHARSAVGAAINNARQVAGTSPDPELQDPNAPNAFLWVNGLMTRLEPISG